MLRKDYRGLKLCDSCWNGVHIQHLEMPRRIECACLGAGCECTCSRMKANKASIAAMGRAAAVRSRAAQQSLVDPGPGYSHVNPQDRKQDGVNKRGPS